MSRGSRVLYAGRRRRRRRSSCDKRIPATKPTARLSRISQTSDTRAVAKTKCRLRRLAVLEHERDRVRDEEDDRDQPAVELRLPLLGDLVGVDGGAAPETHATSLCRCVRGEWPRHESRLLRGDQDAGCLEAEGGADGLAGERAEARPTEVAITAGSFSSFAHLSLCSRDGRVDYGAIIGADFPWEQALSRTKTDEFPADSNPPKVAVF